MAVERVTPCAADYDMWTWRCSECAAVVITVETRIEDRAAVEERRNVARYAVTTPATIEFGSRTVACTVHDISATGAALNLASRPRLPEEVHADGRGVRAGLPRGLAQGKKDRHRVQVGMRWDAPKSHPLVQHQRPSSSAKAEDPVRRGFSAISLTSLEYRITRFRG